MANPNIGSLAATTIEYYHDQMVDNIFKKRALLDHLKGNGGVKMYPGGTKIRVPIEYAKNTTTMTFKGTETLDLTYQNEFDAAEYDYKFYNTSVTFSDTDEFKNSGRTQILDLLKMKIKNAESSLAEQIAADLISGSDADGLVGLDTMIAASGTIGGISGTTYSWWQSYVDSTSETISFADMRTAKNTANLGAGGKNVSLFLTTQALYEKMMSLLTANYQMNPLRTTEGKRMGEAGFSDFEFEGVPVSYDQQATTGVVYVLNTTNYKLGIGEGWNFAPVKKMSPVDQHVQVSHIRVACAAVTDRRSSLAKLSGKTTT